MCDVRALTKLFLFTRLLRPRPQGATRCFWDGRDLRRRRLPGHVDTALEFARDPRDMPVHGAARAVGIARPDRLRDDRMIANRLKREIAGMKVLLQAPPQLGALVPQALDNELKRTVARRLG